ncbi:hypothetical protein GQ43DRAFT_439517 [Delitschia confertaspora ATCC 74209]|uniref:Uncharacterized protein n=1 Tax=Delitschia confertaspora ATCC 74209 TaxID=1513339 RepID=A0A9P4JP77_9PLEO|nr:hypothetical protein GQ43DRAFT_439517 [Delitschia confertaspora ATCC 74209]
MALKLPRPSPRALFTLLSLLSKSSAYNLTSNSCPDSSEDIVYSPFTPYFVHPHTSAQQCWTWANCVFSAADESRKQQFAATALVMGLIPVTLADLAWPEKRLVYVTKPLVPILSVLVLALGLVPEETGDREVTREKSAASNLIARRVWQKQRVWTLPWILLSSVLLFASYAGLVVMEIWSKRSALGCPFPIFVSCWYICALIPATIHTLFSTLRRRSERRHKGKLYEVGLNPSGGVREESNASAIQGATELWPVQLSWAIYYIAGTLVWTSIMAVTVVELAVWTGLAFAVTASSKVVALFICLVLENTGNESS